jgi:hypothetical protein
LMACQKKMRVQFPQVASLARCLERTRNGDWP